MQQRLITIGSFPTPPQKKPPPNISAGALHYNIICLLGLEVKDQICRCVAAEVGAAEDLVVVAVQQIEHIHSELYILSQVNAPVYID